MVDWGVKNFKGKWSEKKENKILNFFRKLVNNYQISKVAIKISRLPKNSQNLDHLIKLLSSHIKENRLRLAIYSIKKMKQKCSKARNKKEIVQYLKNRFSELDRELPDNKIKNHIRQFEAIAVATFK